MKRLPLLLLLMCACGRTITAPERACPTRYTVSVIRNTAGDSVSTISYLSACR